MNWELIGHEWAVSLLKGHIENDRVHHAYLFTGPRGVGRRTLAIRFAQALNCPQPISAGEPCLVCQTCKKIEKLQYPDLNIVQAERRGGVLLVDQIRELRRSLALSPYDSRYKIAILLRFEEANASASNALLKTLEEPAPKVVLIITAASGERLLPTIVSRCQVLRLRPVPPDRITDGLQKYLGLAPEQAVLLAHISGGSPGYAVTLGSEQEPMDPEHMELESMPQRIEWLNDHARLLASNRVERFVYAESLAKSKETVPLVLSVWLSLWRDILLRAAGTSAPLVNIDRADEIEDLASEVGLVAAKSTISAIERTIDSLERNINPRLAIEVMMLDLPGTV